MNKAPQGDKQAKSNGLENEGEGSRTAARLYNEATEKFVASGKVGDAARAAKQAVDGPEGEELRRAEATAKAKGGIKGQERPPMSTETEIRRAEAEGMCHPAANKNKSSAS